MLSARPLAVSSGRRGRIRVTTLIALAFAGLGDRNVAVPWGLEDLVDAGGEKTASAPRAALCSGAATTVISVFFLVDQQLLFCFSKSEGCVRVLDNIFFICRTPHILFLLQTRQTEIVELVSTDFARMVDHTNCHVHVCVKTDRILAGRSIFKLQRKHSESLVARISLILVKKAAVPSAH